MNENELKYIKNKSTLIETEKCEPNGHRTVTENESNVIENDSGQDNDIFLDAEISGIIAGQAKKYWKVKISHGRQTSFSRACSVIKDFKMQYFHCFFYEDELTVTEIFAELIS